MRTKPRVLLLLKVQLLGLFGIGKLLHSGTGRERLRAALVGIGLFLFGVMIVLYATGLAFGLAAIGLADIIPALTLMLCSLVTLMFTFLKSNGVLFGFQDFDMVLSLPVKTFEVLVSRLLSVYLADVLFSSLIMVPSLVVYALNAGPGPWWWPAALFSLFLVPILPMVLAMILGALITAVAVRFRHRNLVTLVLSVVGVIAIMSISFGSSQIREVDQLVSIAQALANSIFAIWPPAALYTAALTGGDATGYLLFVLVSLLPAGLFVMVLSRYYISINSALFARRSLGNFRIGALKQTSPFRALLKREARRMGACPVYILNCCIGAVLMLMAAVALAAMGPRALGDLLELPADALQSDFMLYARRMTPLFLCFFVIMSSTTCVSFNLEGKSRWIIFSLPVEPYRIFPAKIALNLIIVLPCIAVSTVLCGITLRCGFWDYVFLLLVPSVYAVFIAVAGIMLNLKFPKYDWPSEQHAVKQAASMFASMLVGFLTAFPPVLIVLSLGPDSAPLVQIAAVLVLSAITALILARLRRVRLYY